MRSRIAYRRALSPDRAAPTCLIIGAQKGGTTSLHAYLEEHPDVGSPFIKEVHYFTLHADEPLDYYRAHFPRAGQFAHVLESTPYYLFHPAVPERVQRALPESRLVVLLRDPVDRAYSHYNHERQLGHERLDFAAALEAEPGRLAGEEERLRADPRYHSFAHQHFSYLGRGMYAEQLDRWYAAFPREQILVLASEDLFADPAGVLHRVQAWLGLSEHTPASLAARGARSYAAKMSSDTRAELADHFAADSARLRTLTGVQLPWAPTPLAST